MKHQSAGMARWLPLPGHRRDNLYRTVLDSPRRTDLVYTYRQVDVEREGTRREWSAVSTDHSLRWTFLAGTEP